jgi:mannose-6-phosphate isomerase-like protein (cupin superfamily)
MGAGRQGDTDMTQAVDIEAALAGRPVLHGRTKHTPEAEAEGAFATLAPFRGGGVFAGSFDGASPWERHPNGDELVHILDGATTLTIIIDDEPHVFEMKGGMLLVVPQGCWHRFESPDGVTVLTMTPQPTEHTTEEHPTR